MSKILKLSIFFCIYIFLFSTVSYAQFDDIEGHWCENEINDFYESKFVEGYGDGTFRPDAEITRAEFCKIINSYMTFEISGEWKNANMETAKKEGYLQSGSVDETITREEAFVALSRVMKLDNLDCQLYYQDSKDISAWAIPATKTLTLMQYIEGYETNEIKPKKNMTRAELVRILYNFVGIGGLDDQINDEEFSIGYLEHNRYGIEFVEIEDELEIENGDFIVLAAMTPENEDVKFQIISGEEFIEFDEETLRLEGIKVGTTEISAEILDLKKIITIKIK